METILIRERYKVVRVLCAAEEYACVEAVDIQDRETPVCLLNLYEGEQFHRYGKIYASMKLEDCPALRRIFLDGETLVAVFDSSRGDNIDQMFYRGDHRSWQERLDYAEALLHAALTLANLPPELNCPAMCTENLFFAPGVAAVRFRFLIAPTEGMNARELTLLTEDQLKKILQRRPESTNTELDFLDRLAWGDYTTVVQLYAAWRGVRDQIREEYETWEKRTFIGRWFDNLRRWIKRKLKQRIKRR